MVPPLEVPFSYGEVISVTPQGNGVLMWFKDYTGAIRGIPLDLSDPANPSLSKEGILIRRKTEAETRTGKLPPVGLRP